MEFGAAVFRNMRSSVFFGLLVFGMMVPMLASAASAERSRPPASADLSQRDAGGLFASVQSGALIAAPAKSGVGVASVTGDAASWLISEQLPSGAFPFTPGETVAYRNTQGATALGLLRAYARNHDPALLQAAVANGDCQLANCLTEFDWGDGHHRFASHDPLFLAELSVQSGDSSYAAFVDTEFWDRLQTGIYGAAADQDLADYIASDFAARASTPELVSWDLAKLAIAAHDAGRSAETTALMAAIAQSLELGGPGSGHTTYDAIGLSGAIWASALTGIDLDPAAGGWAAANSTADLAAILAGLQVSGGADDGAFSDTSDAIPGPGSDGPNSQATAYAMLALAAFDASTYASSINAGFAYLTGLQQPNGQILVKTGAPANSDGGVETGGEAVEAFAVVNFAPDRYVATTGNDSANNCSNPATPCLTIAHAIVVADPYDNVHIAAGSYAVNLVINKPLHFIGAGQGATILVPALYNPNCSAGGGSGSMCDGGTVVASVVMLVQANDVEISALSVDGINPAISPNIAARNGIMTDYRTGLGYTGFYVHDTTVQNIYLRALYAPTGGGQSEFRNNTISNVDSDPASIGIFIRTGGGVIDGNSVSGASDAIAANFSSGTQFTNNTVTDSGSGIHSDNNNDVGSDTDLIAGNTVDCGRVDSYGIWTFVPYQDILLRDNVVSNCAVGLGAFGGRTDGGTVRTSAFLRNIVDGAGATTSSGDTSGAWFSTTTFYYGEFDNNVTLTSNTIHNYDHGIDTQRTGGKSLTTTAAFNRIVDNDSGLIDGAGGGVSAFTNNWWGCNEGPAAAICDSVTGAASFSPWLVLKANATPSTINPGDASQIGVDLRYNSVNALVGTAFPDNTAVALSATRGALAGSVDTLAAQAQSPLTGLASGYSTVRAQLDNAIVKLIVQVTPAAATATVNDDTLGTHPSASATCPTPDFISLQDAIDTMPAGSTILVCSGDYTENVLVNKAGTQILGAHAGTAGNNGARGSNETVLHQLGTGFDPTLNVPLSINAGDVVVDGIEINGVNGRRMMQSASGSSRNDIRFINNRLLNYVSSHSTGVGINVGGTTNLEIAGNLLQDFANGSGSGQWAMGIRLDSATNAHVHDNVFRHIQSVNLQLTQNNGSLVENNDIDAVTVFGTGNAGIQLATSTDVLVTGNSIARMDSGLLVTPGNATDVRIVCNTVTASTRGLFALGSPWPGSHTMGPILHNRIEATTLVLTNWAAGELVVGSNWYGGATATSPTALIANPLSANPIGNALCGDNTPAQIVADSGSGQNATISTAFAQPLVARVLDALGGAVPAQTITLSAPATGASASLGTVSGSSDYNGSLSSTATANGTAGSYTVSASSGTLSPDASFNLTNDLIVGTVVFDNLNLVYTGAAQTLTAHIAEDPTGVCSVTPASVTIAGSYPVSASCSGDTHSASGNATAIVAKAVGSVAWGQLNFVYSGSTHAVNANIAEEPASSCNVTGTVGPNVGNYPVNATCTGTNYDASGSNTANVTPAPASVSLSYLVQAYDGSPKSALVETTPAGLSVSVTYDGSSSPPIAVGSYALVAIVIDPNYSGSASDTFEIVNGNGDIALVLNGPVDPIHVGDTAQYAATMLANPALHQGETFGYKVTLSKSGGNHPLEIADLATMEIFYQGVWADAQTVFGSIPFTQEGANLVYQFPDGIPGYPAGFPIEDPSWTWNVRFSFADTGTYTTTSDLVDGVTKIAIVPTVTASIATVVIDALPPTDIQLVLAGPAESVSVGVPTEYTGTMLADPSLHTGETFFVKVNIAKAGGTHALVIGDLSAMEIYYGGAWQPLPPGDFTQVGTELVYLFPQAQLPGGFPIEDAEWSWNFRFTYADTGTYTATSRVIHAADAGNPTPFAFDTAAISTTVVDAAVVIPDMNLLLLGPVDDVPVGEGAEYTGTLLADPADFVGRTFWVRVRMSKNGGADLMTVADLEKMELYQGGNWVDATALLQPEFVQDGNDLVYLFPRPNAAFPIDSPSWSWRFRFTYASEGAYGAVADVVDAAEADPNTAPSLANANVSTNVVIGNAGISFNPSTLLYTFDGTLHDAVVSTTPAGLDWTVVYTDSGNNVVATCASTDPACGPVNAGSYTVSVSIDAGQSYQGTATTTLVILPKPVSIVLSGLGTFAYDGNAHAASASVSGEVAGFPAGVTISYNASATAPLNVGIYTVLAVLDGSSPNYSASPANGMITIVPGAAAIIVANGGASFTGIAGQLLTGALPSVRVTDLGGNPVAGATVTFTAGTDSGTLSGAVQVTDSNGFATLGGWILDPTPGTDTASASTLGVAATVEFTATSTAQATGLNVTITDGVSFVQFDHPLGYTITVGNSSSSNLLGVVVSNTLPAELDATTALWQCIPINAATCTSSGTGSLNDVIDLPAGSSVVYLLDAVALSGGNERIINTITATGPNGAVNASDITDMVLFRDGFELGGDGAEGYGTTLSAFAELTGTQSVDLRVDASALGSLERTTLVAAADRSFRIEAMRIGDQVWLRLVAQPDSGVQSSRWSLLEADHVLIALEGNTLMLAGTRDALAVQLERSGTFALQRATH
ncbi:MAG TPA: MBG domain-containing protein [Dokdonella sp.]|nr:MBG domain-containing protein [Dokdonella sp.]